MCRVGRLDAAGKTPFASEGGFLLGDRYMDFPVFHFVWYGYFLFVFIDLCNFCGKWQVKGARIARYLINKPV